MTVVGADPGELRAAANQFTQAADRLQGSLKSLNSFVSNAGSWRGPDAERFRSEWSRQSVFSLNSAVGALQMAAEVLRRNADEQDDASRADGGSGAGSGKNSTDICYEPAPAGTSELYKAIRSLDDSHDGVMIHEVVGPDGEKRLIVYLAGTDLEDSKRSVDRNLKLAAGWVDDETKQKIDNALRDAGYDPDSRAKQPEMMFVGFSQGGMEAQNLVASGRYNATALTTYGSPLVHADAQGVSTLHLRAEGDNTPNLPAQLLAAARRDVVSLALLRFDVINGPGDQTPLLNPLAGQSNNIYTSTSPQNVDWGNAGQAAEAVITGNHGHESVYAGVGTAFDESDDPRFAAHKNVLKGFEGNLTKNWK